MNNFEDHWREKLNDPEEQKGFLKEKVKAGMWEKIQASKKGFEQDWQKKADDIGAWEGALTEAGKEALWHKLQVPLAQFEQQWREKMEEGSQEGGLFLDEDSRERIAATVFVEKENFELDAQDKMNNLVLAVPELSATASKDRLGYKVPSGTVNTTAPAPKEKRRPLFVLRWSHAAALLLGAFSTWLIWYRSSTPLQSTLVIAPQPEQIAPLVLPAEAQKKIVPDLQKGAPGIEQSAGSKPFTKPVVAVKPIAPSRKAIDRVAGKATPVTPLQSAVVLVAKSGPVTNGAGTIAVMENADNRVQEKDIAVAIAKAAPVKKVVHISDIRPAAMPAKGTAIYGRAFGEGKEKRNEKSTMTFNSVLKNYK